MLPFETDLYVDILEKEPVMVNQLTNNEFFCAKTPNSQPMTINEYKSKPKKQSFKPVNKSFEMYNNVIQESYFDMEGMENPDEFINDYASSYPKGIILVINGSNKVSGNYVLPNSIKSSLRHVIVFNYSKETENLSLIGDNYSVENIEKATKTAFNLAANGQAILFQGVDSNFDLFSYL